MDEIDRSDKGSKPVSLTLRSESGAVPPLDADVTLDTPASAVGGADRARELRSVGPYRLIKKLGEGGMGQVWLAEQSAPVKRQVALKLIRAGRYDESTLQRFDLERQSLAIMDHPTIAKVFDAGSTTDGQPYLVMEYVPGLSITKYCDRNNLTTRERLDLFVRVCDGVQHAHQKAIMHRDLKPSNILVVDVDGKPMPRIIDFGLAKGTSVEVEGQTMLTGVMGMVGTPGYISPEQADPRVRDVDTRTDVYSLGVVMYELLTSFLPFDPDQWQTKPLHEVLRQLREDDPPRPSTRVSTEQKAATIAKNRKSDPQQLVHLLRGDLDHIAMKVVERDRDRRYDSASALAADVRRFLNHEPVLATPPSLKYRAAKFIRRNRIAVIAASAIAMMLVALAISMTVQAIRIAKERDRANREAAAAKKVSEFMTGLFKVSDPTEARGNTVTAREILDKGVREINVSLAGQPEVQSRLMATMGEVYRLLGLYREAEPLLEQALDTRRKVLGPEHEDTLRSMFLVAKNLNDEGQWARAEEMGRALLDPQRRMLGPEHPDTVASMYLVAAAVYGQGHYEEAEKLQRELLSMQRRTLAPNDQRVLDSMKALGVNLIAQGRYAEAEQLYREIIPLERQALGPDHPVTLVSMTGLGHALLLEQKYAEADKVLRETLDLQRRVLGPEHQDTLWSMQYLSDTLREEGSLLEAERLQRETLALSQRVLGNEHPETVASMMELAVTLDMLHHYQDAANLYRKVIDIQRRVLGPDHPITASTKYNLACNAALSGHRNEAITILLDAFDHGLSAADASELGEDADFKSLHGDRRFAALVLRAKGQATTQQQK